MIGNGLFATQIDTAEKIFKRVNLFEERQAFPNKLLGAAEFRGLAYRNVYEKCVSEFAYDLRLTDQALLLFVKAGQDLPEGSLSFTFYEPPARVMTYLDFVSYNLNIAPTDSDYDEFINSFGSDFRADYETYVTGVGHKNMVTPIRYDCKASDYRSGVHPASHIHFGFDANTRVATRRVLNPISFALFILRQCYPREWEVLRSQAEFRSWSQNTRANLKDIDETYWEDLDELEMYLY